MAEPRTCQTCGKVFPKPVNVSLETWATRQACSLACRRRRTGNPKGSRIRSTGGGARGPRLGLSADALRLANPARYAGPLTREVWTQASRELEDVRTTMRILRARGGHMGELPRHEARLAAVVSRGWEVRV